MCVLQENAEDRLHDGTLKGHQYFPGRGRFIKLTLLEPDKRISTKPVSSMWYTYICIYVLVT